MSELRRDIGLGRGIALNMIDMVGIGPFITIPLILAAMGGGRGMLAWILGGLLAISDGLVTAELSAEMPASGGSYVFLREAYGRAGRLISFLFLFQILFSAPLSMASGCIGFANYLKVLVPAVDGHVALTATIACIISVLPMRQAMTSPAVVADYLSVLLGSRAAKWISILILWTAFASIFSLMLGYSRILYAAARDGNFFRFFSKLHATEAYPYVSILFLGGVAAVFCSLPLKQVLQAILSIRAIIPFMAQIVGAVILRRRE